MTNGPDEKRPTVGAIALAWWSSLQRGAEHDGRWRGDPGALARLRRADLVGAAMEEVTIDLCRRLAPSSNLRPNQLFERAALIAAVLAHVRDNDVRKVAAAAGEKVGDDRRILHPLRLRRLFAARTPADCLIAFRRLVALLDKKANVANLAASLLDWPDAARGDTRRTRWAFDYYGAAIATPDDHGQAAA
jgi:CRISPR type I-E-associated protein CasB/Cse2